ncbi:MAG: Bifunctional protein glmU, partial [Leptospirillum sp. Group IV 'UBA BS']
MIIDGAILAAGFGTRMASPLPKVESVVLGETLLSYPWRALLSLGSRLDTIHVVVRPEGFLGDPGLSDPNGRKPAFVVQPVMDGTWGAVEAVAQSKPFRSGKATHLLVVNGDGPLLDESLLERFASLGEALPEALCLATAELADPRGYGRILRNAEGSVIDIREESRASEEEKRIHEVNAGIYLIPREILLSALSRIPPDPVKKERFLTTLVSWVVSHGGAVHTFPMTPECMLGVNTQEELATVTALL